MSVSATMIWTFGDPVYADFHQHWLDQTALVGTLASTIATGDTSIAIFPGTGSLPSGWSLSVGSAILIEQEPMLVTAVSGAMPILLTVTRGSAVSVLATPVSHPSGTSVYLLKYSNLYKMIGCEAFLPYERQVSTNLGERSAVFGYTVTGSAVHS